MAYFWIALLLAAALFGHGALWVALVNRLNAFGADHRLLRWINRTALVACIVLALLITGWAVTIFSSALSIEHDSIPEERRPGPLTAAAWGYVIACWIMAGWTAAVWFYRRLQAGHWTAVKSLSDRYLDVAQRTGEPLADGFKGRLFAFMPGNQVFHLHVRTIEIGLPNMPAALEGLSLVHLSDLHLAGHTRQRYFEEVVRQANELDGDLHVITGDILDRRECLSWLPSTLGQLNSRHGTYFVLGNHDNRGCTPEDLRARLAECGLIDVGGGQRTLMIDEMPLMMVGNEAPWQKGPVAIQNLPHSPSDAAVLSIVLSHSPDQIGWAARHGFDLLLAGHVHGGQVRLPVVGPLLAPSWYGVKYACGTFYRPPTVMHVTRGISAMRPLRINCPPELTKIVLRALR